MKYLLYVIAVLWSVLPVQAQNWDDLRLVRNLADDTRHFHEGYERKVVDNDFVYHSFRHDLAASMLTRCEDTPSPMGWETAAISSEIVTDRVGFLWVAAMNLSRQDASFTLSLNGVERFVVPVSDLKDRTIQGEEGAWLRFVSVMTDRHGDGQGYMLMEVPAGWVEAGKRQRIDMVGSRSGSATWLIVFEAADALSHLQQMAAYQGLSELHVRKDGNRWDAVLRTLPAGSDAAPDILTGDGKALKPPVRMEDGLHVYRFGIPDTDLGKGLKISDSKGDLLSWTPPLKEGTFSRILPAGVLRNQVTGDPESGFRIQSERMWMPQLVKNLITLSESDLGNAQIMLMNSSHQDIAWMDTPEKCVVERDTMLLQPLFARAEMDPGYRFDIEDALMIREFIQRHPDKEDLIRDLLKNGVISVGATYIQPYEEMYSGEALVRQLYFGKKWLRDHFDYEADTYWNVDVPGRTLQMPQILAKAGVRFMIMTRQELGFYNWYSPDGSSVLGFSNGHYADSYNALGSEYYMAMDYVATHSFKWEPFFPDEKGSEVIPVLSDWDMSPARDYSTLLSAWEGIGELETPAGQIVPVSLPAFTEVLAPDMLAAAVDAGVQPNEIRGERPALWLYIHGPSHQKAMLASRKGDIMLPQAEKLAVINSLLRGSFVHYPEKELEAAWEAKIYPDHGWGGKGGDITDAFFESKYVFALQEAERIISLQMNELGSQVDVSDNPGEPVLVFNSLGWERSSPVVIQASFEAGTARSFQLTDPHGQAVPVQLRKADRYPDGSVRHAELIFVAEAMPSVGYRVYNLKASPESRPVPMPKAGHRVENDFYIGELGQGGLSRLYDKELAVELLPEQGFAAGEVFTMRSVGNGAGEFGQVQQPDMEGFDHTGASRTAWELVEDGPILTSYRYRQPIRHAVAEQTVVFYKKIKRIDFELSLLNWEGVLYREFRMALPIQTTDASITYEVPYGKLEVGLDEMEGDAGERYTTPAKDIHPRAMQNWINVSDSRFGVTLSSSVVAVDYLDPTGMAGEGVLIQPILLASRRSCHGEGNEYLQTGDHHFSFSLHSHQPGWENGSHFGTEANEPLLVASGFQQAARASLPSELSFFSLSDPRVNLVVIKKAEDSDAVIFRGVEWSGETVSASLESYFPFSGIRKTNLIEDELSIDNEPDNSLSFGPYSIETYKLFK